MRKRTMVVGGGLIGAAAVTGMWLSGLFQGFGTGSGTGDGTGDSGDFNKDGVQANVPSDATARTLPGPTPPQEDVAVPPVPSEVIDVVVEADAYTIETAGGRFQSVELPKLIELAKATTGTDEGVRVRIRKRKSARVSMTDQLIKNLAQAGLTDTEIEVQQALLPDPHEPAP